jgi:hypothetical protein
VQKDELCRHSDRDKDLVVDQVASTVKKEVPMGVDDLQSDNNPIEVTCTPNIQFVIGNPVHYQDQRYMSFHCYVARCEHWRTPCCQQTCSSLCRLSYAWHFVYFYQRQVQNAPVQQGDTSAKVADANKLTWTQVATWNQDSGSDWKRIETLLVSLCAFHARRRLEEP